MVEDHTTAVTISISDLTDDNSMMKKVSKKILLFVTLITHQFLLSYSTLYILNHQIHNIWFYISAH